MSQLSDYLDQMAGFMEKCGYSQSMYQLVREHGVEFKPFLRPEGMLKMTDKECFSNCIYCISWEPSFTYCEGVAMTEYGIAIHHAWLVKPDGTMIDPTWKTVGTEYMGIPFDIKYVHRVMAESGYYGILNNHRWRQIYSDAPEEFLNEEIAYE